mgnify:FL=1
MIKKPVTLQSDLDMESRPIAHLVQEASQYDSTVYIEMDNMKINAKSIMGMMALGLDAGEEVVVSAEGDDETSAMEDIEKFLSAAEA